VAGAGEDYHGFVQTVFGCSAEIAGRISALSRERRYPARTTILRRDAAAPVSVLLIEGLAQARATGLQGQIVILDEYLPGDLFGALLGGEEATHDAEIVAIEDVRAALFALIDFLRLAENHSCVALTVTRQLTTRLSRAARRVYEMSTLSAVGRIHAELLRLAKANAEHRIRPFPVLAELALRVGSTRETASRTIGQLERRGIIRREPDCLCVVAPHRLEELIY
jgi:CRP-like cAMP-binding protein